MSMDDAETPGFFNVNHNVCVRLTDHGRAVHRKNHDDLHARYRALVRADLAPTPKDDWKPEYRPPKEESDGWSQWQAWDLMHEFGHAIGNGMRVPFEPPIFIGSLTQLRAALEARPPEVRDGDGS